MCRKASQDLFLLQVRLFRLAQIKWNLTAKECSNLFNKYDINEYIKTCYDFFHIQGDDANLEDIRKYLNNKGVTV